MSIIIFWQVVPSTMMLCRDVHVHGVVHTCPRTLTSTHRPVNVWRRWLVAHCSHRPRLVCRHAAATAVEEAVTPPPAFPSHYYDADRRLMLKNLCRSELIQYCLAVGETQNRALQLWRWMYDDGRWMRSLDETAHQQNGFAQGFRYGQ